MASEEIIRDPKKILEILDEIQSDDSEFEDSLEEDLDHEGSDSDPDYIPDMEEQEEALITRVRESKKGSEISGKTKGAQPKGGQPKGGQRNEGEPKAKRKKRSSGASSNEEPARDHPILKLDKAELKGKSGKVWKTESNAVPGKTPAINVVHIRPGPQPSTNYSEDVLDCFELFFTDDIRNEIVVHTNLEISKQRENFKDKTAPRLKDTNLDEICALLGLLILSGALKNNHLSTDLLFNDSYTGTRYLATMSKDSFEFLINCLRFDDRDTRDPNDPLSPVRKIWDKFVANCTKHYRPGSYVTIDEQLIGFRGRCKFRMYIPSKPGSYGIKVVMMCDAACSYMISAIPYVGKGSVPNGVPAGEFYVESLIGSIKGSNRNVTMDNWFTSVPLVKKLKEEYNLTVIGTVKKNKTELPPEFVDINFENRKTGSSMFLFDQNMTAVSYKAKDKKLVCLLSSAHHTASVNETSQKPEIVLNYNQTKAGVDTLDQMCHGTNVIRKTKRWPLCYFYNMINIAMVNAYVIYVHNVYRKNENGKPLSRVDFMLKLFDRLAYKWLEYRYSLLHQHRNVKEKIESVLVPIRPTIPRHGRHGSATPENSTAANPANPPDSALSGSSGLKRGYCQECHYKLRRKASKGCSKCFKLLCGEHQVIACKDCTKGTDT